MSLFSDAPGHFKDWLERCGARPSGAEFASRAAYGDYVEDTLIEALAGRVGGAVEFTAHAQTRATGIRDTHDAAARDARLAVRNRERGEAGERTAALQTYARRESSPEAMLGWCLLASLLTLALALALALVLLH